MAVSTTNAVSGPYLANGATTVFPFTFTAPSTSEVAVITRDTDGVDTTINPSLYAVSLTASGGGSVTFDTAPASGLQVLIYLDPSFTQEIEFENGSAWLAEPVNEGNDRSALRDQALKRDIERAIKVPIGEAAGILLPTAEQRAGMFLAFDAGGDPVPATGTGSDGAFRTDAAASTGSSLVGFIPTGTGATATTVQAVLRNSFVTPEQYGAVGDGATDDTTAIQNAINTGRNVYFPSAAYKFTNIYMQSEGQQIWGRGTYDDYGTTLIGSGTSGRMIEMRSTRESTGDTGQSRTGMSFSNFKIETGAGSSYADILWIEDGVFHSFAEKLQFRHFVTNPTNAVILLDSGSALSYSVHTTLRDIVIRGAGVAGSATPKGIHIRSAIEAQVDNVSVYDCEANWVLGDSSSSEYRQLSDCAFWHILSEIGNTGSVSDTATAMQMYAGANIKFFHPKFVSGRSMASTTNQHCLAFDQVSNGSYRSVSFIEPIFSGNSRSNNAVKFNSGMTTSAGVHFVRPDFANFVSTPIVRNTASDPDAVITEPTVAGSALSATSLLLTGQGFTYDPTSLADGDGETTTYSGVVLVGSEPILVSHSKSLQGMILTGYRSTTDGTVVARLQNETGGVINIDNGTIRFRKFHQSEIAKSVTMAYDPASLADGGGLTATIPVPGAALGDLVAVGFYNTLTGNLGGIMLTGYVSAAGTVSARFQNETGSTRNLSAGTLTAYVLKGFDRIGTATYDPPSLADGAGDTTTVTVTGAELGDFVVVSFSNDLQGIIVQGYVSATDTVSVRFQNETGGTIDLASGTLTAAVYKRHLTI
jgi:hypothetical protein